MKLLERLKADHRTISAMLQIVEAAAFRLSRGEAVPLDLFQDALDFFENFADGCHEVTEESELFPLLAARGLEPDTRSLVGQHDAGRFHLREMRAAFERFRRGDVNAIEALAAGTHTYVGQARAHIRLEDEYFFPLADKIFSTAGDLARAHPPNEAIELVSAASDERQRYRCLVSKCLALVEELWKDGNSGEYDAADPSPSVRRG